jgi:hypothetical protein
VASQLWNGGTLTGSGTLRVGAPMSWESGTVSVAGGLEVLNGATLTMASNGQTRVLSQTSFRNHGTVATFTNTALLWQGGTTVAVTNESDGLWTFGPGSMTFTTNGTGALSFTNAGTMQGAGNPATTLNMSQSIAFSNTGTISNMLVQFF